MQPTNKPIGYLIKQLDLLLTKGIDSIQEEYGFTRTRWQVLHTISQDAGIHQDNLKKLMQPFAGATETAGLLNGLISADILAVGTDEICYLTQKGKRLHEQCLQKQTDFRRKLMAGITPEAYATTIETLEGMIRNLG